MYCTGGDIHIGMTKMEAVLLVQTLNKLWQDDYKGFTKDEKVVIDFMRRSLENQVGERA